MTCVWLVRGPCVARTFLIRRYSCNSLYYWELCKPTVCYGHMKLTGCLRAPYEPKCCKSVRDPHGTARHAVRARTIFHRFLDPYRHRRARGHAQLLDKDFQYGIFARRKHADDRAGPVVGVTGIIRKPVRAFRSTDPLIGTRTGHRAEF